MKCPYCEKEAEWVENKEIYGRNFGKSYMSYLCRECDAYVGCHNNTEEPLGTMADRELRELRKKAHKLFDPTWKGTDVTRGKAYQNLKELTGVEHIAWANKDECQIVIDTLMEDK